MPRSRSLRNAITPRTKPQVADRIVRHDCTAKRDQVHVRLVDPYGMDDVRPLAEQSEVVNIADQRPAAELLVAENALQLGLQDMDIERQVARPA